MISVFQKQRGKRPSPDSSDSKSTTIDSPVKKIKTDAPMSACLCSAHIHNILIDHTILGQYEREVKSYAGRSLKDDGIGVRPLVK